MQDLGWLTATFASLFAGIISLFSYFRTSKIKNLKKKLDSRNRELLDALTNVKKLLEIEKTHIARQNLNRSQKYQIRGRENKLSHNAEPARLETRMIEIESEIKSN